MFLSKLTGAQEGITTVHYDYCIIFFLFSYIFFLSKLTGTQVGFTTLHYDSCVPRSIGEYVKAD